MKLFIGVPTSGAPAKPFLDSLAVLEIPPSITSVERSVVSGNYVPAQRELILRRALDAKADLLLMCDDDMVIPPHALSSLVSTLEANPRCALAGALYYSRDGFRPMAVDDWDPDNTTTASIPAFGTEPVDVSGIGFGCVLVRLAAVRMMQPPYFSAQIFIEPAASRVRVCNEDYLFCDRLRRDGWRVVLHAGVRCGHYDRASGSTFPLQWEPLETTTIARMAVAQDGVRKLVALAPAQAEAERHEEVPVTYVWENV